MAVAITRNASTPSKGDLFLKIVSIFWIQGTYNNVEHVRIGLEEQI
jgi:hypothetical protein